MSSPNSFRDLPGSSPTWEKLPGAAEPPGHLVQFYETDERFLTRNVSRYLWQGLQQGDALTVIATAGHNDILTRQLKGLGADVESAVRDRQLTVLDAHEMLAQFMVHGKPDWDKFHRTIGATVSGLRTRPDHSGLRAYGEMVGVLWRAGQFSAAVELEEFWNTLLRSVGFKLYCAYPIDVFGKEFQIAAVDALLCTHTHLLSAGPDGLIETSLNRAMDEILGSKAKGLRLLIKANYRPSWAALPSGEATILWLRNNLRDDADEILGRARQHYAGSFDRAHESTHHHAD
jgi:hypothetical protein